MLAAYVAYHRRFYDAAIRRSHAEGIDVDGALANVVGRGVIAEETPYTLGAWGIVPDTGA